MGLEELEKRIKQISLVISRIPKKTKEEFIALANTEFSGDDGMCLKWCLEQAIEYQNMKSIFFQNIDMKLDNILGSISQTEEKPEQKDSITTLSGKRIGKGGEN
jgi:hypothetical protein